MRVPSTSRITALLIAATSYPLGRYARHLPSAGHQTDASSRRAVDLSTLTRATPATAPRFRASQCHACKTTSPHTPWPVAPPRNMVTPFRRPGPEASQDMQVEDCLRHARVDDHTITHTWDEANISGFRPKRKRLAEILQLLHAIVAHSAAMSAGRTRRRVPGCRATTATRPPTPWSTTTVTAAPGRRPLLRPARGQEAVRSLAYQGAGLRGGGCFRAGRAAQSPCSTNCTIYSDNAVRSIHDQWLTQTDTDKTRTYAYDAAGRLTSVEPRAGRNRLRHQNLHLRQPPDPQDLSGRHRRRLLDLRAAARRDHHRVDGRRRAQQRGVPQRQRQADHRP